MKSLSFSHPLLRLVLALLLLLSPVLAPVPLFAQDQGLESLRQSGQAFRSVAKKVSPAVVFIQVEQNIESSRSGVEFFSPFDSPFGDEFLRRFFGESPNSRSPRKQAPKKRASGQGSGFIITPDGYILTNNHVVDKADSVKVTMLDGREYNASIVGTDPPSDLAVIKIDESDLPFLRLGDSEALEVGDWVLAVGNPFGLSHTLTAGIVSAKGRSNIGLSDYENFIQTDAAINPGNSGGPLVNLDGKVVGINTAIFSRSGGSMGIGFAIPVNMAKQVRKQLIEDGEVTRGQLGVYIQQLTSELAETFGLKKGEGVLVAQVIEDSPAEHGGLKRGDVILRIDGKNVGEVAQFRNQVALTAPGTKMRLTLQRDGKKKEITVVIGRLDGESIATSGDGGKVPHIGLSLQSLTPEIAERLGYDDTEGVLVTAVEAGSRAEEAGIQRNDLILEIDRQPVTSPAEAKALLGKKSRRGHLLLIRHGESTRYLALKID
ncbi:MAG: serine protease [Desulfuromonas sp.]|nr:MAG: serine protease [Desulfuromonas sp.]